MMTDEEAREYRQKMKEASGRIARQATEAVARGELEEAERLLETALSASRIARGERP